MRIAPFVVLALATPAGVLGQVTTGATVGAVKLSDQRSEQALTGVLTYPARPWLSLSVMPSFVHVSDVVKGQSVSSDGAGDLPLTAAATRAFAAPGAPVLAAALTMVLPTGNAACGLGSGTTAYGVDIGAGVSPSARLHLSGDASRSVSGLSAESELTAPRSTSLRADAAYDASPIWTTSVSLGIDVGAADSTQALSRVIGVGASRRLGGALAMTFDGSVGLSAASPKWGFSVGIGTAYAGTSPVSLASPLKHLKSTFSGGVNRGGGSGKIGCR